MTCVACKSHRELISLLNRSRERVWNRIRSGRSVLIHMGCIKHLECPFVDRVVRSGLSSSLYNDLIWSSKNLNQTLVFKSDHIACQKLKDFELGFY